MSLLPEPGALLDLDRALLDVPPAEPFHAWRLRHFSPAQFAALDRVGDDPDRLGAQQLTYIAWCGLLAPTSHNTVPQRFRIQPEAGAIEVWLDRQAVLTASDVAGRHCDWRKR